MKNTLSIILNTLITLNLAAIALHAALGDLDPTFDGDGIVITRVEPFTNYANAVAIQTDGKIIAVGFTTSGSAIVRYNASGSLDNTFNGSGIATLPDGAANGVAIQTDGKIIVVGHNGDSANLDFKVLRYNTNGTLDTTFDGDGIMTTAVGSGYDVAYSIAIQTDGKIVVSGRADSDPVFTTSFAIVRYNTDGTLDTTFDSDGIVIVPGPGNAITDSLKFRRTARLSSGIIFITVPPIFLRFFAITPTVRSTHRSMATGRFLRLSGLMSNMRRWLYKRMERSSLGPVVTPARPPDTISGSFVTTRTAR